MPASALRLTIIGSGTGIPVPERGYAGVLVEVAGEQWLLDAGPGTLQRLARLGVTYQTLDRVFLTHLHPDHSLDLVSILFAMHIPPAPPPAAGQARTKPLSVCGPPGLRAFVDGINAVYPGMLTATSYPLAVEELAPGTRAFGEVRIEVRPMQHSLPAFGYRVEWQGAAAAYSGDTDVCDETIALGRDVDLLILECSVTDERKVAGHLTPTECGQIAVAARCRRLVLTHFYPVFAGYDILARVRRHYAGPVDLARDRQSFELP